MALALTVAAMAVPLDPAPMHVLDARLERRAPKEKTGAARSDFGGARACTILAEKGCSKLTLAERRVGNGVRRCHDFYEHDETRKKDIVCRKSYVSNDCRNHVGFFTSTVKLCETIVGTKQHQQAAEEAAASKHAKAAPEGGWKLEDADAKDPCSASPLGENWIEWRKKSVEVDDNSRGSFIGAVRPREGVKMVRDAKPSEFAHLGAGSYNTAYALRFSDVNEARSGWQKDVPNSAVLRTQEPVDDAPEQQEETPIDLSQAIAEMWLSRIFGKESLWREMYANGAHGPRSFQFAPGPRVYTYWIAPSKQLIDSRKGEDNAKDRLRTLLKGSEDDDAFAGFSNAAEFGLGESSRIPDKGDTVLGGSVMEKFDGSLSECIEDVQRLNKLLKSPCSSYLKSQARNQIIDRIRQVASMGFALLDIKPDNILVRAFNEENEMPANWPVQRWGASLDIRLADFDPKFSAYVPDMDPACLELIMLTILEGTLFCHTRSSAFLETITRMAKEQTVCAEAMTAVTVKTNPSLKGNIWVKGQHEVKSDWIGAGKESEKVDNSYSSIYSQFMHYLYRKCVSFGDPVYKAARKKVDKEPHVYLDLVGSENVQFEGKYLKQAPMGVFQLLPRRVKSYRKLASAALKTDFSTGVGSWLSKQTFANPEMKDGFGLRQIEIEARKMDDRKEQKDAEQKMLGLVKQDLLANKQELLKNLNKPGVNKRR